MAYRYNILRQLPLLAKFNFENKQIVNHVYNQARKFVNFSKPIGINRPYCHQANINEVFRFNFVDSSDAKCLKVKFENNKSSEFAYVWLRDNCQCPKCFDSSALSRRFLLADLSTDVKPHSTQITKDGLLNITWDDGHESEFSGTWMHDRAFLLDERAKFEKLKRIPWGNGDSLVEFDFNDLMTKDEVLLNWFITLEERGAVIVKNTNQDLETAGLDLVDHIGFTRKTHYGIHSPVYTRPDANNLAYSNAQLGLHVDLPYYNYQPGIIFLHMVRQENTEGGESEVSDSLFAANYLKEHDPEAYNILTNTNVYFWDKGVGQTVLENKDFMKIQSLPIIKLDCDGEFALCSHNNHTRDSYQNIPANKMKEFYRALSLFNKILYENSFGIKLKNGEMIVLDNTRCLHGRKAITAPGDRYLSNIYMDWDEIRCKRRRLQDKLGIYKFS